MPALELNARTAWENIFKKSARWTSPPRLLPVAEPRFETSFQIEQGAKIFTVGSCFARNIEMHLEKEGFDIPSRRYFAGAELINKYNPYSILQEFRWALGLDQRPGPDARLIPVTDNGWFDLQLHNAVEEAGSREDCIYWIEQSARFFDEMKTCRYFILTLGLIEVWYDRETNTYINEPLNFVKYYEDNESLQRQFADRFVFRILNFSEAYAAMHEVFTLIKQVCPDPRAILTVSPVPLVGSFGGDDVMVANTYSKSLLRAVAEEIRREFNFIDYFPSYESITLSPPEAVWEDDRVHVKDSAVAVNVRRMVEAYLQR